jgi:hypothetical protein
MSIVSSGITLNTAYNVTGDLTGNLIFQSNGTTEAVRIDTSQNVGIGTANPTQKLEVNGWVRTGVGASALGGLELPFYSGSASSRTWRIRTDSSAYGDFSISQATTQGGSTFSNKIYIDASGNVTLAAGLTVTNDITINTVVVGKGGGNDSTSVCVGSSTLPSGNTGTDNNAFGVGTLFANTTGSFGSGFGRAALRFNTTGNYNTAFGANALLNNTTASNNTAVGYQAGYTNSTGTAFTALGYKAGYASTGDYNTVLGYQAGTAITSGAYNCFVGGNAGLAMTTGVVNTFIGGVNCGSLVTTGSKNSILGGYNGNQGGLDIRTASNYIVLSDGDGNPRGIFTNNGFLCIGGATTTVYSESLRINTANNQGIHINETTSSSSINYQYFTKGAGPTNVGAIYYNGSVMAYQTTSDYRLKENVAPISNALNKINLLKPVTYTWIDNQQSGEGFIAHELQEHFPDAVSGTKDEVDENGKPKYQGMDASVLIATMVKAIQELKTIVDTQAAEIAELKAKVM